MAKTKISEYSSTSAGANLNTDINTIDIDEGCAPSGINNAIRTLMAQIKDFQTGVTGDSLTLGGALSGTSATFSGNVTASAISGASLTLSGALSGTSATFSGNVTASAISGASLTLSGNITASAISGASLTLSGNVTASAISGASMTLSGDLTVDTNTLYVDSTNNEVGIGTSSPSSVTGTGLSQLVVGNTSGNNGVIVNCSSSGNSAYSFAVNNAKLGRVGYDYLNNMTFQTNNAERMRINSSGTVSINTTITGGKLVVENTSGNQMVLSNKDTGASAQYACYFLRNNSIVGSIQTTNTATIFVTSSDHRLKENNVSIDDGISRVKLLKPYRFNFIADADKTVDGFFAHEVQDVVPEAITGTKDAVDAEGNPEYQGIDQSKLVPLLTAALQEAITKIEDLEARIQTLENK